MSSRSTNDEESRTRDTPKEGTAQEQIQSMQSPSTAPEATPNLVEKGAVGASGAEREVYTPSHRYPKLDGVLYHFYSKTVAVITHSRLTHYDASPSFAHSQGSAPSTPLNENANVRLTPVSSAKRANKWFDLDISDYEIFRDEVRLWRNISTLIPAAVLDGPSSARPLSDICYVPPMIVDVILDPSLLTEQEILTLDQTDAEGSKAKRRVRVYQQEVGSGPESRMDSTGKGKEKQLNELRDPLRKPIILETWRLDLAVCNPPEAPDLPTLYRQATANLKELLSVTKLLPSESLFSRLQRAKSAVKPEESESELIKIGIRLGTEEEEKGDDITRLREPLGGLVSSSSTEANATKITEKISFQPLLTAIGTLQCSVEYRIDADFFVEDVEEVMRSMKDLELDEDFFRPSAGQTGRMIPRAKAISQHSPLSASPSSVDSNKARSLLSATSERRLSNLGPEGLRSAGVNAASNASNESVPRSSATAAPAASTSVFSTSAISGKPVAGLASLRRSPSITSHGSSPSTAMTSLNHTATAPHASSPVASSAMATDAAFLTMHGRRTSSTSERRVRTLSTLSGSGERGSPPATAAASTNVGSASPSQQVGASRPGLPRASISGISSLRTGSYSPSSPSPLAQQMSANHQPTGMSRLSSSPSQRMSTLALSASPSLRSIFQNYPTSHSQLSVSSLSRTPPKSLIEGGGSSLGLQSTSSVAQGSPSQTSLVGESRQPSVAPQMIKRYTSNFNYRQGRQAAVPVPPGGFSIDNEHNYSSPYSKSWQTRIEQRQTFAARSLGREDLGTGFGYSGASSGTGGAGYYGASLSPRLQGKSIGGGSAASQEDDLDDFVRMIDSNQPKEKDSRDYTHPSSSSSSEKAENASRSSPVAGQSSGTPYQMAERNALSFSNTSSSVAFTRNTGWNRNHVDEMLSKMQNNMRDFGTSAASRGSEASGSGGATGTSSSVGGSDNSQSPNSQGGLLQVQPASGSSPSFVRSPLSRVGFSAASASRGAAVVSPATSAQKALPLLATAAERRKPTAYQYDLPSRRGLHSQVSQAIPTVTAHHDDDSDNRGDGPVSGEQAVVEEEEEEEEEERGDDGDESMRPSHRQKQHRDAHARRSTSGGSLELFPHQPHSYDPLEDEAVGRLELVHDEDEIGASPHDAGAAAAALGGGGGGGGEMAAGATTGSSTASRLHHNHHHHSHLQHHQLHTTDNNYSDSARRRAEMEMARNFGQVVSSGSSRGGTGARASLSPWRNRLHSRGGAHIQQSNQANSNNNNNSSNNNNNGGSPAA